MLQKISLQNFRNFEEKLLEFSGAATVIVGPNAAGKTNILEAINLLSTGKSFKARIEEEMVNYKEELGRVKGKITEGAGRAESTELEVVLTRGVMTRGNLSEKVARKRLMVQGVGKRLVDFAGHLKTVLFVPKDLDLVTESPSLRRKFLDSVLSQVDREYGRAILSYEKGLRRRNRLLLRIREEGISRSHLYFWDRLLIKNGEYITRAREEIVDFINKDSGQYQIEYDKSIISEGRLKQYKDEEVASASTLVGPHRDDLVFYIGHDAPLEDKKELAKYGSRGEQRMGVLWLKMAELAFIEEKTGEKPTLLLDDIFSELDYEHRKLVAEIAKKQQTVLTTVDPHYIEGFGKFEKINLKR